MAKRVGDDGEATIFFGHLVGRGSGDEFGKADSGKMEDGEESVRPKSCAPGSFQNPTVGRSLSRTRQRNQSFGGVDRGEVWIAFWAD